MTTDVIKKQAFADIDTLINEAYAAIAKAEKIAIEHKLSFGFSVSYGMGGHFYGDIDEDDGWSRDLVDGNGHGWISSSQGC